MAVNLSDGEIYPLLIRLRQILFSSFDEIYHVNN